MNHVWYVLLLILTFFPALALAQPDEQEKVGFFGSIAIGGGWTSGKSSQLDVTDDNKRINSLDERATRESEGIVLIMGELGYNIVSTGTKISLGNQTCTETSAVSLTVDQTLEHIGTFQASFGFGEKEVWKDPFLVGVEREETDETAYTVGLQLQEIAGSGATASLTGTRYKVDDDLIGSQYQELKRDGTMVTTAVSYAFPLGENQMIIPSLGVKIDNRDGDSNSSKQAHISLAHTLGMGSWNFATSLSFSQKEFNKMHPIFHKTREEKGFAVSELISFAAPFGWSGFSINCLITYDRRDANINFYDSDALLVGAGIGYSF